MDKQEYLNQISAKVRPPEPKKQSFVSSVFFKVIVGGILALILITIATSMITPGTTPKDKIIAFKIHLDNFSETLSTYQPALKSSNLRSKSASLSTVISNTNREVSAYLTEKYEFKVRDAKAKITDQEAALSKELNDELFEAKINGMLDRIYAHKIAYEISMITARETEIIEISDNEALKDAIRTSYASLNNLYINFSDYSEAR